MGIRMVVGLKSYRFRNLMPMNGELMSGLSSEEEWSYNLKVWQKVLRKQIRIGRISEAHDKDQRGVAKPVE